VGAHGLELPHEDGTRAGHVRITRRRGNEAREAELAAVAVGNDARVGADRAVAWCTGSEEVDRAELTPRPTQLQFAAAIRVRITAKGRRRYEAAAADIRAMEEELLSSLTPAEREALLSALPKLAARR
jgi:hypothetical protein